MTETNEDIAWDEMSELKTAEAEQYEAQFMTRNKGNKQTKKDAHKKRKNKRKSQKKARR